MSEVKLTNREMEIALKGFQCLQNPDVLKEGLKIDTEKLAQIAGFANAKSANSSWLSIKKKILNGATVDTTTTPSSSRKAKGKAPAKGDAEDDNEATFTLATPSKHGKAIKSELTDAEGGDADTEQTPGAETPVKSRAKKAPTASKPESNGNADNDAAETTTPTNKRKRAAPKPKDPNATPSKRAKKTANTTTTTATAINDDDSKHAKSIFGGDTSIKNEEGASHALNAEEEVKASDAPKLTTHNEDEVA